MILAPIFHDHAVLQRGISIPVWGRGTPGEDVTVRFAGHEAATTVGDDGAWFLRLPPQPAGGPFTLEAEAASGRAVAADVLVGEVWLCSGQSNMGWQLHQSDPEGAQSAGVDLPQVRLLAVTNPAVLGSTGGIGGTWKVCTPATLAAFSAVGGWFGRTLHRELGVPIGLICNAWGGTRVQAWTSRNALIGDPLAGNEVRLLESFTWRRQSDAPRKALTNAEWEAACAQRDTVNQGFIDGWAAPDFADDAWTLLRVPVRWNHVTDTKNGIVWFRRSLAIPAAWAGRELELSLGAIDKHDDTYVDGTRVGGMSWEAGPNSWCTPRVYRVPGSLVKAGLMTIAVRARSHVYDGGLTGPASILTIGPVDEPAARLPLAGAWRFNTEVNWGQVQPPVADWGTGNPNTPGILFASRVAPLLPYALRGVIWYQGESNGSEGRAYRRLMPLMIHDWRRAWGQGDFPFLQVQLANYHPASSEPGPSPWAELREAQLMACAEPGVGMAVAIDIGEANDIHPKNKRDVGLRLASWALAETYGKGGPPSGPLFTGAVIEDAGRIRCRFRHVGGGLHELGGPLRRFEIAGADRKFVWAQALIDGDSVVVSSSEVPQPMAVRYAWANNPEGCNLYNTEGLPASPFRSDDW